MRRASRNLATIILLLSLPSPLLSQAVVQGTVIDFRTGLPISFADLTLTGPESAVHLGTTSDDAGAFRVEVAEGGRYELSVRRIGYASIEAADLVFENDDDMELEVRLAPDAVLLDPVVVISRRGAGWGRLGRALERAERNQLAGRGRIYMRDELEGMQAGGVQWLVDSYLWSGQCRPAILLNGIPAEGSLFGVSIDQLEAVELYRERHDIPAEHYRPDMCGAALLWTRTPSNEQPWSWARFAVAGAFAGVVMFFLR